MLGGITVGLSNYLSMLLKPKRCIVFRNYHTVTHCIFDMDGTIIDSEVLYANVIRKICSKYDKTITDGLLNKVIGVTDRDISQMICKELEIPISPVEFEKQMKDMTTASANTVPTKEGANKILNHLKSHSILAALATNSTGETVRMYAMAKPELFGHFHHMVSVDDAEVHHGKPHPDLFLVAASRFPAKADPKHCLVFEDSPVGVEAGISAGMQVVMVQDKRLMNTSLRKFKATLILTTLMDFSPEIFGLPPYNT